MVKSLYLKVEGIMERETDEVIAIGAITMRFLVDGTTTDGHMAMAEMVVQPQAKVPPPHRHDDVDETIRVIEGALTYRVDDEVRVLQAGDHCFSPRGSVHHFSNQGDVPARALVVFSPASIGPAYFRDVANVLGAGGPPDPHAFSAVMARHGIALAT
ncbi:cupin domain-containing protein [Pseudorhodoferax aquiterrae]|nr:cupin domain-containing protein [Pseudorhodoferax aquiterrae]